MTIPVRFIPTHHNTCGECTLCCKVLGIVDLTPPKLPNTWCPHAAKSCGCKIYESRPQTCKNFECIWLSHNMPAELRPDKVHGVLGATSDGENLVLFEDTGFPGAASSGPLKKFLTTFVDKKDKDKIVVIVCGKKRRVMGRPDVLDRLEIKEDPDGIEGLTHVVIGDKK